MTVRGKGSVKKRAQAAVAKAVKDQAELGEVHKAYVPAWGELLEALADTDIPKNEYRDSLATMLSNLQTQFDAANEELAAEAEGEEA